MLKLSEVRVKDILTTKSGLTGKQVIRYLSIIKGPEDMIANVKMKRLTIDIPETLHRKIKAQCAMRGTKIADEVRELLIQKYGNG